ncbi:MAG TPA: hypothetical protein VGC71_01780 [Gaiellales bacterium]|jgi:hypothetical protein
MDLVYAVSQGLGLAVAAGFFASVPLAVGASVAALGFADGSIGLADDGQTVVALWVLAAVEFVADAVWPGAEAGARLLRRIVGGGLAFELVAGDEVPYVGLAIGAAVAAGVALSLRQMRTRAIRGGGDVRGTAIIEDGAGVVMAAVGAVPLVGFVLAAAAAALFGRTRRREQEKYKGLRVLR